MARQAKVSIGLDFKPLREDTKRAQAIIGDLGKTKIDSKLRSSLRDLFSKDLQTQADAYKRKINEVTVELRKMGQAAEGAANPVAIQQYIRSLNQLQAGLRQTRQLQIANRMGGVPSVGGGNGLPGGEEGGGGQGGGRGLGGRLLGGFRGALGTLGVGLGVAAALARTEARARVGLQVRELSGGASVSGSSQLGFTDMERRERALGIVRESGRDLKESDITRRVDMSERLQRAYGISGQQFAGSLGAARRAGIGDQEQFLGAAIGDAVAMKLSGSAVGEYLASMTNYLSSISKGVDVKQDSLRGFAGALGSLDFFKRDPERIFDALSKLEGVFKGGGSEYQNYATYRAIQSAGGNTLTPAGVDVRRNLGLFGGAGLAGQAKSLGMNDLAGVFGIGGDKVLDTFLSDAFKEAMSGGKVGGKMNNAAALSIFQETTGLKDQQGAEIFMELARQAKSGKGELKLPRAMGKALEQKMMSPDDRMKAVMGNFDASVVKFSKRIDDMKNLFSDAITSGTLGLVNSIDDFSEATGMFTSDVEKFGVIVTGMMAGKAALGGMGGMGGGGGVIGVGGAGKGMSILGGITALAFGLEIGTGIRKQLNEWSNGEWDKKVDEFWTRVLKGLGLDIGGDKAASAEAERGDMIKRYGKDWEQKLGRKLGIEEQSELADVQSGLIKRRKQGQEQKAYVEGGYKLLTDKQRDLIDTDVRASTTGAEAVDILSRRKADKKKREEGLIGKAAGAVGIGADAFVEDFKPEEIATPMLKARGGLVLGMADGGYTWTEAREKGWTPSEETANETPNLYKDRSGNFYKRSLWDGKYYKVERDTDDYVSVEKIWRDHFANRKADGGLVGRARGVLGMADGGLTLKEVEDQKMTPSELNSYGYATVYKDRSGNFWKRSGWDGKWYKVERDTDDFESIEKTWRDHFANRKAGGGLVLGMADGGLTRQEVEDRKMTPSELNSYGYATVYKDRSGNFWKRSGWDGKWYKVERDTDDFVSIEEEWRKYAEAHGVGKANGGPVGVNPQRGFHRGGAMGRDNIDAKLMMGEFVVNARDTSKNMMALVHANAGGKIVPAASGGLMGLMSGGRGSPRFPSSVGLNSATMESALGGNTRAVMMLAAALGGLVGPQNPGLRPITRGQVGVRYG